jgi:purine nucleosidase
VTHKALTSRAWIEGLRAMGTRVGHAVAGLTDFFERFDMAKYGSQGAPLHDACVIGYLLRPDLFTGRHINVEIETRGEFTTGMTVADWWRVSGREPNAMFIGDVDRDGFFALLTERLARL